LTEAKQTKKSRYQEAIKAYDKAVKKFRKGELAESGKLFSGLLDKYGTEIELADRARLYLAICAKKKDKTKLVLKSYDDFIAHGIYLMNEGMFNDALKDFSKAGQLEPKEAKVPYLTAINHILAGNKQESLDSLKNAISLDGNYSVMAQNESDFESIWEDEEFKAVTKG
jgi:tetratricopeptide (TPR) repeat protein